MKPFHRTALAALLPAISIATSFVYAATPPRTPNIVIIYIDDMGYADIGPFGAKGYATPHLGPHGGRGDEVHQLLFGPRRLFRQPGRADDRLLRQSRRHPRRARAALQDRHLRPRR